MKTPSTRSNAFAIVGVATEVGIEPTARHGPQRGRPARLNDLKLTGDAIITDVETFFGLIGQQRRHP